MRTTIKPKIIHIMSASSSVTIDFASFLQKNFSAFNYFYPIGNESEVKSFCTRFSNGVLNNFSYNRKQIIKSLKNTYSLLKYLNQYDLVVWHSLFLLKDVIYIMSIFNSSIIRKSIWMEWGADLYEYQSKNSFLNKLYLLFVKKLFGIITIFPGDIITVRNSINYKGNVYDGNYYPQKINTFTIDLSKIDNISNVKKDTINILIGHSTNKTLNHIYCLNLLSKFKNENIRIVLPLNYGDSRYAEKVIYTAQKIYSEDKLFILKNHISLNEYNKILDTIDVCLFDTKRQLGLGNLYYLLLSNKSIYLNKEGVMYNYWKSIDLDVRPIEQINQINTVKDLIYSNNNKANEKLKDRYDEKEYLKKWSEIFEKICIDYSIKYAK